MPRAGDGYHLHVTGLTHDERGYPSTDAQTHDRLVRRLSAKVLRHATELVAVEEVARSHGRTLLLRMEAFNLTNHANILGRAQTTYGDTGTVNST